MTALLPPRLRKKPAKAATPFGFWLSAGFIALVVLVAILARWIAPYGQDEIDFTALWGSPSAAHLLGTDQLGRDLLSRIMLGTADTLIGPVILLLIATVLGITIGMLAAWRGGWVDTLLARITDVMFAFPGLLFVVLVISVFGKGAATAIVALALAYTPVIAKFVRSLALSEISKAYIDAYRTQGMGGLAICVRGVIPNLLPPLVGYLVVLFGEALMSIATLSFLGFGAQPPSSEWGLMVQEGQAGIVQGHFLPTLIPGAAIALVVIAVNVVGVRVADRLLARKEH